MKITDTFFQAGACFANGVFSKARWDHYMENCLPHVREMVEQDAAGYDFDREILPVLNQAGQQPEKLWELHSSFLAVTGGLEERIARLLGTGLRADVVLYLGLCNGAGWAAEVNGRPTVLLGMEKIVELNWVSPQAMTGLVYHELGHLWHFQERKEPWWEATTAQKALWQLYTEGMAMYCEQLLCGDMEFYHQDRDGWHSWCRENRRRLFQEYLRRVRAGESVQDFFGDWCSFEGRSDVGYYLGAELVRTAAESRSRQQLLDLGFEEALELLGQCAGR